jgi:hypothetical protein
MPIRSKTDRINDQLFTLNGSLGDGHSCVNSKSLSYAELYSA